MAKNKKEIPLDIIQQWLKDEDWRVRMAAMNACQGREIPLDIIQQISSRPQKFRALKLPTHLQTTAAAR